MSNPHDHQLPTGRRAYDEEITSLRLEIDQLKSNIKDLTISIEGLIDAWRTAKGITSFVKWLSGLITGFTIIWAIIFHSKG